MSSAEQSGSDQVRCGMPIAEEMNKLVGTVKSEASRAMAQMREQHTTGRTGIDSEAMAKLR